MQLQAWLRLNYYMLTLLLTDQLVFSLPSAQEGRKEGRKAGREEGDGHVLRILSTTTVNLNNCDVGMTMEGNLERTYMGARQPASQTDIRQNESYITKRMWNDIRTFLRNGSLSLPRTLKSLAVQAVSRLVY